MEGGGREAARVWDGGASYYTSEAGGQWIDRYGMHVSKFWIGMHVSEFWDWNAHCVLGRTRATQR